MPQVYLPLGPREGQRTAMQKEPGGVGWYFHWYAQETFGRLLVILEPELRGEGEGPQARDFSHTLTLGFSNI